MNISNLLFLPLFYLLIRLSIIKCRSRLMLATVKWAGEQSMQIIAADQIKDLCWHRGPGRIWFKATSEAGQTYAICLELRIRNVQSLVQILRNYDFSYETKLVSKTQIEFIANTRAERKVY